MNNFSSPAVGEKHKPAATIFREYDIRGIVGKTLHEADAYAIGRAFASRVANQTSTTICVGYDGRLSSPQLVEALCLGLLNAGVNVTNIGCGPTPMLYFATHMLNAAAGIMVTGSHNPPDHNGFKIVLGGKPFFGVDIQKLRADIEAGNFPSGKGKLQHIDQKAAYVDRL